MSKVIAITGGIGAGKTYVSSIFSQHSGIPFFNSDLEAKKIMNNSTFIKKKIISIIGPDSYIDNNLNTEFLRYQIFSSKKKLKKINELIHNEVNVSFKKWLNHQTSRYVLMETAILFEHKLQSKVDLSILVTAPMKLRLERIYKRDNISKKIIDRIIENQWNDKKKLGLCDYFIENIDKKRTISEIKKLIKVFAEI